MMRLFPFPEKNKSTSNESTPEQLEILKLNSEMMDKETENLLGLWEKVKKLFESNKFIASEINLFWETLKAYNSGVLDNRLEDFIELKTLILENFSFQRNSAAFITFPQKLHIANTAKKTQLLQEPQTKYLRLEQQKMEFEAKKPNKFLMEGYIKRREQALNIWVKELIEEAKICIKACEKIKSIKPTNTVIVLDSENDTKTTQPLHEAQISHALRPIYDFSAKLVNLNFEFIKDNLLSTFNKNLSKHITSREWGALRILLLDFERVILNVEINKNDTFAEEAEEKFKVSLEPISNSSRMRNYAGPR